MPYKKNDNVGIKREGINIKLIQIKKYIYRGKKLSAEPESYIHFLRPFERRSRESLAL